MIHSILFFSLFFLPLAGADDQVCDQLVNPKAKQGEKATTVKGKLSNLKKLYSSSGRLCGYELTLDSENKKLLVNVGPKWIDNPEPSHWENKEAMVIGFTFSIEKKNRIIGKEVKLLKTRSELKK